MRINLCLPLILAAGTAHAADADHWSFRPVRSNPTPTHLEGRNPIDGFVAARLRDAGLSPAKPAGRATLARRLSLVALGLPPDPDDVDRFAANTSPDAWERLVDRTLASPAHGERLATKWLDLARFGETHGFETNRERPNAWPYRDWVIAAFNDDKPYDDFVKQQIAGDTFGEPSGTGFLVAGPYDQVKSPDVNLTLMQRPDELTDIINATGTAFLGLTLGCARCHDHKFDPVSQEDFYAVQAVFAGVKHGERPLPSNDAGGRGPVSAVKNTERFEPTLARRVRFTVIETNSGQPCLDELEIFAGERNVALGAKATCSGSLPGHAIHQLRHINDGKYGNPHSWICDEVAGWVEIELADPWEVDRVVWGRDREGRYRDRVATKYRVEVAGKSGQWKVVASSDDRPDPSEMSVVYAGTFAEPGPTHLLYRGEPAAKRQRVSPETVAVLGTLGLSEKSSDRERRRRFAEWVAGRDNPLTPRVVVNRLWQFHFGAGLVATPSDFGGNGVPPTHPLLLDWLAGELTRKGWSLKAVQRELLLSDTWRQSSRPTAEGMRADAGCRLWWRFPPRRLEAEAIRDGMLAVTGELDRRMGGPGFSGFAVHKENVRHYFPKSEYGPEDWRRMVYMTKVRQERESVFGVFDCPDASQVVAKRSRSTTPLQALNLFNSPFVMQQAGLLADRLGAVSIPADRVRLAYRLCYGREPDGREVRAAEAFIDAEGLTQFGRALLNSNEFVFIP